MSNTTEQIISIEESASRPNHLKFISVEIEQYAGLDYSDKSLVIHFPDNGNITELSGDQGVGKTSLIAGLKTLLGETEPANAINGKTKSKAASLTFEVDGETYKTRVTNKSFTLVNIREVNGKSVVSDIKKPKDILSSFIGPIGVSPTFLQKKKSGEEQISWIKELSKSNPELAEKENALKAEYDKAYKERTGVNRDVSTLKTALVDCGYFTWNEESNSFVSTPQNVEDAALVAAAPKNEGELKAEYDSALAAMEEVRRGTAGVAGLHAKEENIQGNIDNIDREIARLLETKTLQQTALQSVKNDIERGQLWMEERKDVPAKFEKAQSDLQNSAKIATTRQALELADKALGNFNLANTRQAELNTTMSETEQQIAALAKQYTPNIEGLEVELGGSIDNPRPAGVYYGGTNISYLSESELWQLCLQIWKITGISVVFIENSTTLGSEAISRLNWFAENGGKVFVSTLQRGYRELTVSFHTNLK